jgi:hypothetical protein
MISLHLQARVAGERPYSELSITHHGSRVDYKAQLPASGQDEILRAIDIDGIGAMLHHPERSEP